MWETLKPAPQLVSRLASLGLVLVLVMLAVVTLWGVTTRNSTLGATTSLRVNETLQRAQYQLTLESALQHEYATRPSRRVLKAFDAAAASLSRELSRTQGLESNTQQGEVSDQSLDLHALAAQRRYILGFKRFVAARDTGDLARAEAIDRHVLEPGVLAIAADVATATRQERSEAIAQLHTLQNTEDFVRTTTLLSVSLGVLVLAAFWWVVLAYQHRSEDESRAVREAEAKHETLVEQLPVAAYMGPLDRTASTQYMGREIEVMLGYSRQEWIADPEFWPKVLHGEDRERVLAEHMRHMKTKDRFSSEYRMRTRDGRVVWVHDEAVVVWDESTQSWFQHGVMIDITDRKRAEEALEQQALHDSLTELPNRTLLHDRLKHGIMSARRDGKSLALLLMDLDRFKEVNDTFGHHYGDLLLQEVGARLRGMLRQSDTVARLGGDEFAIILPGANEFGATLTARHILRVLSEPVRVQSQSLDIGASIGISLYPKHGEDPHTLLQRADVAMYTAKRSEGGCAIYEVSQDMHTPDRLAMISELRRAIESDGLTLYYQPKTTFRTGSTDHVEALARWEHPERGLVPPDEFISLAEAAGLIKPLTLTVLSTAMQQCCLWHKAGYDISVAVNISPRLLHDPELVSTIRNLLERWKVSPCWLSLEITESAIALDPSRAMETLTELHTMGVAISIDDFGTGYSSLGHLRRLPVNQIKIDKSFVLDMVGNPNSTFIVRSIIDLAHNLGLEVVAEGVEERKTWDMLADMGCDVAQGFYLSPPLTAAQLSRWLDEQELPSAAGWGA